MKPEDRTTAFSVAPYLISAEGTSASLALLLAMLYQAPELPRTAWSVSHTVANRAEFIKQLRAAGSAVRRVGICAHSDEAATMIQQYAGRLKLQAACLRTQPQGG